MLHAMFNACVKSYSTCKHNIMLVTYTFVCAFVKTPKVIIKKKGYKEIMVRKELLKRKWKPLKFIACSSNFLNDRINFLLCLTKSKSFHLMKFILIIHSYILPCKFVSPSHSVRSQIVNSC